MVRSRQLRFPADRTRRPARNLRNGTHRTDQLATVATACPAGVTHRVTHFQKCYRADTHEALVDQSADVEDDPINTAAIPLSSLRQLMKIPPRKPLRALHADGRWLASLRTCVAETPNSCLKSRANWSQRT